MREPIKRGLRQLLLLQLGLLFILALLFYVGLNVKASYSALLGGGIFLLPSCLFAIKLFKHSGVGHAKKIVRAFYTGEAMKLSVSMLLFALVFIFVKIDAGAFFGSFIVMQLSHWLAPQFLKTR
jgi:ATP synthase protein I